MVAALIAGAAVVAASAGCSAEGAGSAASPSIGPTNPTATRSVPSTPSTPAARPPDSGSAAPGKPEQSPPGIDIANPDDRRFASRTITAQITGFDLEIGALQFHLVRLDNGHYTADPADRHEHWLRLATNPAVLSALLLCSNHVATIDAAGRPTKRCTRDQLITAAQTDPKPNAELRIDATNHITTISELYSR